MPIFTLSTDNKQHKAKITSELKRDYWINTMSGLFSDAARQVAVDGQGNVYLVGQTASTGSGINDIIIAKYNTSGSLLWQRLLGDNADDYGFAIVCDNAGNVYVGGYSTATGSTTALTQNLVIAQYNSSGVIQWQRTIGEFNSELSYNLACDSVGNVYLVGVTNTYSMGSYDIALFKYNSSGTALWQKAFSGPGLEYGYGVACDSNDNVIVTGVTTSVSAGSNDIITIKCDTDGNILWQRALGKSVDDAEYSVTCDNGGNIILACYSNSVGEGNYESVTVKYDANGSLLWQKTLGNTEADYGYGVACDNSGNIFVTGTSKSAGTMGSNDVLIVKYATDGSLLWQRMLGGIGADYVVRMACDNAGNIIMGGYTTSGSNISSIGLSSNDLMIIKLPGDGSKTGTYDNFTYAESSLKASTSTLVAYTPPNPPVQIPVVTVTGLTLFSNTKNICLDSSANAFITGYSAVEGAGSNDIFILKYNSSGTLQWQRGVGGTASDLGYSVACDPTGNVYVVGGQNSASAGGTDLVIVKYDNSGNWQWQRTLGGNSNEYGHSITCDTNGNVFVSGYTAGQGAGSNDFLFAKYNSSGTLQWQRALGGTGSDVSYGIVCDSTGNVFVSGYSSNASSAGGTNIVIAKYDTNGTIQWQRALGGSLEDLGYNIACDTSGNIYVTGYTNSINTGSNDIFLVKYDNNGALQWQRAIGGAASDACYNIACDSSGNVYITGSASGGIIVKYDPNGSVVLQKQLPITPGAIAINANSLYITSASVTGFLVYTTDALTYLPTTAFTLNTPSLTSTATTLQSTTTTFVSSTPTTALTSVTSTLESITRIAEMGALVASDITLTEEASTLIDQPLLVDTGVISGVRYYLNGLTVVASYKNIARDSSSNLYIVGYTATQGVGSNDIVVAKYTSGGSLLWQKALGGTLSDVGWSIACDSSGNVFVTGNTLSQGAGSNDIIVVKYNTSGTLQWYRYLGGAAADVGTGVACDSSGNVFVTGYSSYALGAGSNDIIVVKYNTNGVIQWQRALGGASGDVSYRITCDTNGNVIISGAQASQPEGGVTGVEYDLFVAKYDNSGTLLWQSSLGGVTNEFGFGVACDTSGNVFVTGYTLTVGQSFNDLLVVKYDSSGTLQWQKIIGNNVQVYGYDAVCDSSGNLYVTGTNAIVKYNTSGTMVWQKNVYTTGNIVVDASYIYMLAGNAIYRFDINGNNLTDMNYTETASTLVPSTPTLTQSTLTFAEYIPPTTPLTMYTVAVTGFIAGDPKSICIDGSSNVYIIGYETGQGAELQEIALLKYNNSGVLQWQRALGGTSYDVGYSVACNSAGDVYLSGRTQSAGAGGIDIIVAKYDSGGTLQWQRALGGASTEYGQAITCDSSGNVYVAGYSSSAGAGSNDIVIVKYNSSGTLQWQRALGGTGSDVGMGITCDSSGNVFVTGYSNTPGTYDIITAKYNSSGALQWQRALGGTGVDYGYGITCDTSGNVFVTGRTNSAGAGGYDVVLVKYDTSGTLQWQRALGGIGNEYGYGVSCDSSGNVFVSTTNNVAKYNTSGTLLWQRSTPGLRTHVVDTNYLYAAGTAGYVLYPIGMTYVLGGQLTETTTTFTQTTTTFTQTTTTLTETTTTLTSSPILLTSTTTVQSIGALTETNTTLTTYTDNIPYGLVTQKILIA